MPGATKKICQSLVFKIQKDISSEVKSIASFLPKNYSLEDIELLIKEYYPYEREGFQYQYLYYKKKDEFLVKKGKKIRFQFPTPIELLKSNQTVKKLLKKENQVEYALKYDADLAKENADRLMAKRKPKIDRITRKIEVAKFKTQIVSDTPFLDKLIGLYERKKTSQLNKLYIINELTKFYNKKIINFFFKLNDTELNIQLREIAFRYLQSFNLSPRLRKAKYMKSKSKNKKTRDYYNKVYKYERNSINGTPQKLDYLIDTANFEKIKKYDYFISHSSKDIEKIEPLIKLLNKGGLYIYCDWLNDSEYLKRNLVCDETISVIKKQMEKSEKVLFVDSPNSKSSIWCKYELNYATELNKSIYFTVIDNSSEFTKISKYNDKWFVDENYKQLVLLQ